MSLLASLYQAVHDLESNQISYALAGGLVASLYRKEPRATADIDLAILTTDEQKASQILEHLGLKVHAFRKANLEGGPAFAIKKGNTPVYILCGRKDDPQEFGVDFILSNVPWVESALERSQANRIDFGSGGICCLTLEDLVISKLYSVKNQATRFMDLDDLKSIFESDKKMDWLYLRQQMKQFNLSIPDVIQPFVKETS